MWRLAGMILSAGVEGGLMFTVAHELVHSNKREEKLMAASLLSTAGYMHWHNSHLAHHCKVRLVPIRRAGRV
jgi:alkane 1-monooxygenase